MQGLCSSNALDLYRRSWTFGRLTFMLYKFSLLIRISYAEFGLSYTADEQTFQAVAQWRYKTESRTVYRVYKMLEKVREITRICGKK